MCTDRSRRYWEQAARKAKINAARVSTSGLGVRAIPQIARIWSSVTITLRCVTLGAGPEECPVISAHNHTRPRRRATTLPLRRDRKTEFLGSSRFTLSVFRAVNLASAVALTKFYS